MEGIILNTNLIIRKETPADYKNTELMTMRAFWNIHWPGCNEHFMVRMIREAQDYIPEISCVAEMNGKIVGAIYYTKAKIVEDTCTHDVITFGPLAVEPTLFGMGIGKALLDETIELARKKGYSGIVLVGEANYYPKFGFQPCDKYGISDANGCNYDELMCLPLNDTFLSVHGRLIESSVYEEACSDEMALVEMSKEFPQYPKVKITDGFLKLFEKHIGVVEMVSQDIYQIRFWELLIPAHLDEGISTKPKVGENVLFAWKPDEEAVIKKVCGNNL
jgi:predicted N-acetyltransferase YhbS